jgi:hypothetical protein
LSRLRRQGSDLGWRQLTVFSDRQVANRQDSNPGSDQLEDFAAGGLDHAPHLAIASFANRNLDERAA